jgi:TolA-binding protein
MKLFAIPALVATLATAASAQTLEEVISETIVLNSQSVSEPIDIIRDYEDALTQFDMGNYSAAERKLQALSETLKEDDTLTFETKFYIAECHIAKNEFSQALELLKKLNKSADKNGDLKQKTLVRLGQIYCVLNMKKDAENYFNELKKKYPNSIYNQLGQCK